MTLAQGSPKEIEQTIKALDTKWSASSASKNVDQWVSFYGPDALLLAPNEPIADTPTKIKKSMAAFLSLPDLSLSFWSDKVWVAKSLDVAYEYGHYSMSFKDPKGNTVKDQGKSVEVWRKQKTGKWLCVVDMFNSDLPMGS
jgi:ketosteroid isomerase-like protein